VLKGRDVLIGKKINLKMGGILLEKLKEEAKDGIEVSLKTFIAMNLDALSSSGKNLKELYEYLKAGGLDVGTYYGFQSACYRAGLRRWAKKSLKTPKEAVENVNVQPAKKSEVSHKPQEAKDTGESGVPETHKAKSSKYNPGLPPIILPGGIEAIIDLETGAKRFEI
jgi:hypothetical protein